jgi:hypothetical protein
MGPTRHRIPESRVSWSPVSFEAGFEQVRSGSVHPWIRHVQATNQRDMSAALGVAKTTHAYRLASSARVPPADDRET